MKTIQTAPSAPDTTDHSIRATRPHDVTTTIRDHGLARDIRDFLTALDEPDISTRQIAKVFESSKDRISRVTSSYDWFCVQHITEQSQLDHKQAVSQCNTASKITVTPEGTRAAVTDSVRGEEVLTQELEFLSQPHKPLDNEYWDDLRTDLIANIASFTAESLPERL